MQKHKIKSYRGDQQVVICVYKSTPQVIPDCKETTENSTGEAALGNSGIPLQLGH